MSQTGRNDPCPCGSGKKFKKCCLPTQDAAARDKVTANQRPLDAIKAQMGARLAEWVVVDEDGLDDLSNGVLDLIDQQRWDEAFDGCRRLLDEFPEVHDGLAHSARIHDARGNHELAADFWRRTVEFIEHPDRRDGYDQEVLDDFREQMAKSLKRAGEPR